MTALALGPLSIHTHIYIYNCIYIYITCIYTHWVCIIRYSNHIYSGTSHYKRQKSASIVVQYIKEFFNLGGPGAYGFTKSALPWQLSLNRLSYWLWQKKQNTMTSGEKRAGDCKAVTVIVVVYIKFTFSFIWYIWYTVFIFILYI